MSDFLETADRRQPRKRGFDRHPYLLKKLVIERPSQVWAARSWGRGVNGYYGKAKHMLVDFFLIVVMLVWFAELYADGAIGIEHAASGLILMTIVLALSRRQKWLRHFLEIAFGISVLLVFLVWHQGGDLRAVGALLVPLLAVLIVLFCVYFFFLKMFGGSGDRK